MKRASGLLYLSTGTEGRGVSDPLRSMWFGGFLLMSWARIDDTFDDHPKVLAVLEHEQGGAAIGLWTLCLTWAHRNTLKHGKTPGLIAASLPRRYLGPGARDLAAILVKEGLWEPLGDGEGWQIHDFHIYLPTAKTSEARSRAGKKGAASRWAQERADGTESHDDGNLPSGHSNLPEAGHTSDSKTMASDGSRARARRVQVVGSTGSSPVPDIPVPASPAQLARAQDAAANAGTLVAEWIRACRKRPPDRVIGQISGELKKLIDEDHEIDDIRAGLEQWRLVGKNPSTLASFVNEVMNASSPNGPRRGGESTGAERAQAVREAGKRVQAMIDGGSK